LLFLLQAAAPIASASAKDNRTNRSLIVSHLRDAKARPRRILVRVLLGNATRLEPFRTVDDRSGEAGAPPVGIASTIPDRLPAIVFEPCFRSNSRFVAAVADELNRPGPAPHTAPTTAQATALPRRTRKQKERSLHGTRWPAINAESLDVFSAASAVSALNVICSQSPSRHAEVVHVIAHRDALSRKTRLTGGYT
jgi:hypothetical protein